MSEKDTLSRIEGVKKKQKKQTYDTKATKATLLQGGDVSVDWLLMPGWVSKLCGEDADEQESSSQMLHM